MVSSNFILSVLSDEWTMQCSYTASLAVNDQESGTRSVESDYSDANLKHEFASNKMAVDGSFPGAAVLGHALTGKTNALART